MGTIRIKEAIIDPSSDFNIKRFKIGNLSIENPIKTIDTKNVIKHSFELQKKDIDTIILETTKSIKIDSIKTILSESDSYRVKQLFGFREWHSDYSNILTPTFEFNPFKHYKKLDDISGFFDYYYNFSDLALFIPNINVEKGIYTKKKDGTRRLSGKEQIIKLDQYLQFVDEVHETLNFKNKKPIFVPLSLKLNIKSIEKIAKHYLKNEYTNVWVDFQASSTMNRAKCALLRHFNRKYKENEQLENLIMHSTNIKREIISHKKDDVSPSSDILASIIGSNFVGSNRNPQIPLPKREIPLTKEERMEFWEHKARVFHPKSYYYLKVEKAKYSKARKKLLMNKKFNILYNSVLLNKELKTQTNHFLKEIEIKHYIKKKQMIKEYKNGKLVDILFDSKKKVDDDWF